MILSAQYQSVRNVFHDAKSEWHSFKAIMQPGMGQACGAKQKKPQIPPKPNLMRNLI